ncbi:MAG: hypothetical protein KC731_16635 [Myxococcales bacterium]|nr:hypothetical protein [Myxococcales bacterium]
MSRILFALALVLVASRALADEEDAYPGWSPVAPDVAPRVRPPGADADADASLSLALAMRQTPTRRDFAGTVLVSWPFELFVPGPAKAKEAVITDDVPPTASGPPRASRRSEPDLPRARGRDAREAVSAAQRAAGVDAALSRLDDLETRARWSALLPEVRLRATRLVDESASLSPTSYDPTRTTSSGGASLWLEARTSWRLDRLVFASEEIAIERMRRAEHARAQAKRQQVVDLLGAFLRARLKSRDPALDTQACLEAVLVAEHLALQLDVVTDGWFSRHRERWPEDAIVCPDRAEASDDPGVVDFTSLEPEPASEVASTSP